MLPSNVSTGRVTGRFIVGVQDGPDPDDEPDFIAAVGTIDFTASVPYLPNPTDPAGPVTLLKTTIRGVLDDAGNLCTINPDGTPGVLGLRLVATDDPDLLVQNWTWNVTYRFQPVNGTTPAIPSHGLAVLSGAVVDLTVAVKVPSSPGYGLPQSEAAVLRAEAAAGTVAEAVELVVEAGSLVAAAGAEADRAAAAAATATAPTDATMADKIGTKGTLTETALSAAIDGSLAVAGLGKLVSIPASMSMTTLSVPPITRLGAGRFRAAVDLQSMRPAPGVTYYVSPTGTDVADGLTPANPTTIKAAVTKEDVGTIMYAPGEYMRNEHFLSTITGKSINHIASGPGVKVTGWNNPGSTVWTRTSGNIYQTSRSATNGVVDVINRSEWGDYTEYVQKADLASITGPGQWAIVGSIVYAWAIGDTDFTVISNRYQIRLAMSGVTVGLPVSGGVHYVRGINYERTQISAISGALVIAEDVTIKHSLTDGVYVNGLGTGFIGNRVTVSSTGADGLSYTAGAEFIEIDCKAHHCGTSAGATTNNATTAHVGTKGIRLNGAYEVSGGPVVADVNDAKTWNLGCSSGGSTAPGPQDQSWRVDAVGYEATPATMWLDECTSSDATNAYKATGGGRLYLHATSESNLNATDSSSVGTIAYYEA